MQVARVCPNAKVLAIFLAARRAFFLRKNFNKVRYVFASKREELPLH
jgi:hypothetical protein